MSSSTSWRPNLPESQLFNEKTCLQGMILSAVAYGVTFALFILIVSLFITRLKVDRKRNGRASWLTICLLIYVCVTFILSTLSVASQAEMTQLAFIENRNFPGGPGAYVEAMFTIPISYLGNCCNCIMNWFSDSLLLWRCSVIYRNSRISVWLVMAIPGLMLLASFVMGIISLEKISRASLSPWSNSAFASSLIYLMISISLNIVLSLMIVIPLYLHRKRTIKLLGRRHAAHYTGIISMVIESEAISVVVFLWFLIPFVMRNPFANIPLLSMIQIQTAAAYMIIFRVAKGIAWTSQTAGSDFTTPDISEHQGHLSNIQFRTASVEHPGDSSVTSKLDGRDVLDIESNSPSTVHESSPSR